MNKELLTEKIEARIYDIANENGLPPLFVECYSHFSAVNHSLDDASLLRGYYLRLSLDFSRFANTCSRSKREESQEYGNYLLEPISEAWLKETVKPETDMMIYFAIKYQNTAALRQYHAEALEEAKRDLEAIRQKHNTDSVQEAVNGDLIFSLLPLINDYKALYNAAA